MAIVAAGRRVKDMKSETVEGENFLKSGLALAIPFGVARCGNKGVGGEIERQEFSCGQFCGCGRVVVDARVSFGRNPVGTVDENRWNAKGRRREIVLADAAGNDASVRLPEVQEPCQGGFVFHGIDDVDVPSAGFRIVHETGNAPSGGGDVGRVEEEN